MSMRRLSLFFLTLIMGLGWATAQTRTVTGTVISSEDNEPMIGVNVVVVGQTNIGAPTDINGKFTLSVPANAKQLQFSAVGYKTVTLDIKSVMNVTMNPDAEVLDEVVVVGYGTGQKISTVSGSVARVSSEKLENKPVANVMDALQGQVSGMQVSTASGDPNAVAEVKIHGKASLGAGGAPLYIVDGVQTSADIVMAMNPNDFESFTVLKDASSTSIYGARAANGVIVITTKKGKRNQDGVVAASVMYGVSQLISRKPMNQLMSGQELFDYQLRHTKPGKVGTFVKGFGPTNFRGVFDKDNKYAIVSKDYDWLDVYMGNSAPLLQADLSVSGGSENITYYVSGGYFSQDGISVDPSHYRKINLRTNVDARVKDWLRIGVNVSGGTMKQQSAGGFGSAYLDGGTFGALVMPKYYSPYWTGSGRQDSIGSGFHGYANYIRVHKQMPVFDGAIMYMPNYTRTFITDESNTTRLNGSGYAQFTPIDGLTLKTQYGIDWSMGRSNYLITPDYPHANGLGSNRQGFDQGYVATWTNTAEYKWRADDINNFTFLLGHEFVDAHGESFAAAARGLLSRDFMYLSHGQRGDYLLLPSQSSYSYAFLSFFGRVNYTFKDWMAFDVTLRHDRSSRFGKNHQGATFFSVGGMYDIYRTHFKDLKWMSTFRFKANYGTQGNSSIPLYASEAMTGIINYTNELAFGVTSIGNEDLTWESQGMLSVGIDYGMWEDRLSVGVSYYNRKTANMLMNVPLPYATGYSSRWANVGAMTNQGIDLDIEYKFLDVKDWEAFFSTTFNYNAERVDKLFSEETNKNGYRIGDLSHYDVGKPIVFYQARFAGINPANGKQMWYKKDGTKTEEYSEELRQRIEYAKVTPPISGGFSLGVTWRKQLSLTADFSYMVGAYSMNNDRYFLENNVNGMKMINRSKKLLDEWTPENPYNKEIPKFGETFNFDDRLLENASFLRMKNLQLSYMLPNSLFKNTKVIHGVRVYFSARNLFTVTHKSFNGFDPEVSTGGFTMNKFPSTRQFVGGLQLQF